MKRPLFRNLEDGGRQLAAVLASFRRDDLLVIGIAAGGVPVACVVAETLDVPLDIVLKKTLFLKAPGEPQALVNVAGTCVRNGIEFPEGQPQTPIEFFTVDAFKTFQERVDACRGDRPVLSVDGKTILLIDDGIRTGETVMIAARALRQLGASRVIVAVPVAALEARNDAAGSVDEIISLHWPSPFGHVGMFFDDFNVPDDTRVRALLDAHPNVRGASRDAN